MTAQPTPALPPITHYGVVAFSGDPAEEHPDEDLRGLAPHLDLICAGASEAWCWEQLTRWTAKHPLKLWQTAEVLTRDPVLAAAQAEAASPRPDAAR